MAHSTPTLLWLVLFASQRLNQSFVLARPKQQYIPPWDKVSLRPVLSQCRLQEPDSSSARVSNGRFEGYASERFQLIDDQLHMSQFGGYRNELRHNPYFNVADHVRLRADVVLPAPTPDPDEEDENFCIFQSHVKDFLDYARGPLMMVRWMRKRKDQEDHLWVNLREDLRTYRDKDSNNYYDLGPRPEGMFTFDLEIKDTQVTIKINDEIKFGPRDMSYWREIQTNYFKAGLYLTSWNSEAKIQIDELFMGPVLEDAPLPDEDEEETGGGDGDGDEEEEEKEEEEENEEQEEEEEEEEEVEVEEEDKDGDSDGDMDKIDDDSKDKENDQDKNEPDGIVDATEVVSH